MYYFFKNIKVFFVWLKCKLCGMPNKDICMIGHRGYSSCHMDNSEEAFISAAQHGSGGVETDIRLTSDNRLILCHNGDAEYTDGTRLNISESTFDELIKKPLKNKYNNNTVYLCTFERYLEICKEKGLICFIELKGEFSDEKITEVFNLAQSIYDLKMCSLQSFNIDNLKRARALFPSLPLMLTYGRGERDNKTGYGECLKNGFDIDSDWSCANKKMIRDFHSHGLKVGVWTCNDMLSLSWAHHLGVDYIESDVY